MTTIHLVHGIRTPDPMRSIGKLAPYFEAAGWPVMVHSYGNMWAFQSRWLNDGIAERIGRHVGAFDVLVGHSNGCDIIRRIIRNGVVARGAVLINPALDSDSRFAAWVRWVHVYHNRGDSAVALARLLLAHPWGAMGRDGYTGRDERFVNFDCWPIAKGHSAIFKELDFYGPLMVDRVRRALDTAPEMWAPLELV